MIERIAFVLVEPQSPGNVGAAARALRNMGLGRLTLVGPVDLSAPEARRMAMSGRDVLESAAVRDTLAGAVAGAGLTIATTRRAGKNRGPVLDVRDAAVRAVQAAAAGNDVAFVFGREDAGLTTAELDACHLLARIPADDDYPSLNLAGAVLLTAYEVRRAAAAPRPQGEERTLASAGQTEQMFRQMASVLEEIGFLNPQNPEEIMHALRRLLGRAAMDAREVSILRGILRQVRWAATRKR